MKKRIQIYLHRSKESNMDLANKFDIDYMLIKYLCNEVPLVIEIDTDTGKYEIVGVNGFYLSDEVINDGDVEDSA